LALSHMSIRTCGGGKKENSKPEKSLNLWGFRKK
jgi:hypothetical protein